MAVKLAGIGLLLLFICLRTWSYGAYQSHQGNKAGAAGIYVLGGLAFIVPLVVFWFRL